MFRGSFHARKTHQESLVMYQNDEVNVDAKYIALMHAKLVTYLHTIHTDTLRNYRIIRLMIHFIAFSQ